MSDQVQSRLTLLKGGQRNQRVVDWPGKPGTRVAIRRPVGAELMQAKLAAAQVAAQVAPGPGAALIAREAYEEEYTYQLLSRIVVDPQGGRPLAASAAEFRDLVDLDEVSALMVAYEGDTDQPLLEGMTPDRFEQEARAQGEASASGTSSSSSTERTGKRSSAFRVLSSPMDSSSTSPRSPASRAPGSTIHEAPDNPAAEGPGRAGSSPGSTAPGS